MKKINTGSIFFRISIFFILTTIGIISFIIIAFFSFRKNEDIQKKFMTPIEHICKILKNSDSISKIEKLNNFETYKHKHKFKRYQIAIFKNDKCIYYTKQKSELYYRNLINQNKDGYVFYKGNNYLIFKKQDKVIIIGSEKRKVYKKIKWRLLSVQLVLLIFLIGLMLFILYFFIRKLLIPVNQLISGFDEVKTGNFKYKISSKSENEFNKIISSFNEMSEKINLMFKNNLLLIGNISHDIKFYLTRLKMQIEVEIDDDDVRDSMNEDIDKINDFINKSVEVYKANSSREQFKIESINFTEFIKNKFKEIPSIDLSVNSEIFIQADRLYLSNVLDNLYENASNYKVTDSIIKISLEKVKQEFNFKISNLIENKLDKEELKLIFQPFYRFDKSRNQNQSGSGLGLFLVKNIVEKLDFKIESHIEKSHSDDFYSFSISISGNYCK